MNGPVSVMRAADPTGAFSRRSARLVAFALVAASLGSLYYVLATTLFAHGFAAANLMFFGEKAELALHGMPPRLINLGFVYPPLSFLLLLPFGNPFVAQAAIAGVVIATLIQFLDRRPIDGRLRWLAKAYLIGSPLVLFETVEDYSALLFNVLFAFSVYWFARYLDRRFSLDLFFAALLLALTFFVDFRSMLAAVIVVPAMTLPFIRRSPSHALAIALAVALPLGFFATAWMYVNWIFLGDALAFVHGRGSFFRSFSHDPALLLAAGNVGQTVRATFAELAATLPVTLPYFVGLICLRDRRAPGGARLPQLALYLAPVAVLGLSIYFGAYRSSFTLMTLFVFTFIVLLDRMYPSRWLTIAFALALGTSFIVPAISAQTEEREFARGIYSAKVAPNLDEFRGLAAMLAGASPRARILTDDTDLFPLIYLIDAPERFILPYQYEFSSALSKPVAFARYVVVSRTSDDAIARLYPAVERGELPGFRELARTRRFIAFVRVGDEE
ncbi:MAG: hypothetical protein ACREM8_03645 [Vulcanimicrobiaceae bacterium]